MLTTCTPLVQAANCLGYTSGPRCAGIAMSWVNLCVLPVVSYNLLKWGKWFMYFFPIHKLYVVSEYLIIVMIFEVNVTEEAICLTHRYILVLLCLKIQPE
jgi:hypothetical protein